MESRQYICYCEKCINNFQLGNNFGYNYIRDSLIHMKNYDSIMTLDEYYGEKICDFCSNINTYCLRLMLFK